jgi:hypothetical protein
MRYLFSSVSQLLDAKAQTLHYLYTTPRPRIRYATQHMGNLLWSNDKLRCIMFLKIIFFIFTRIISRKLQATER